MVLVVCSAHSRWLHDCNRHDHADVNVVGEKELRKRTTRYRQRTFVDNLKHGRYLVGVSVVLVYL